jgi:ABC-2 type transport system ATP-binding protein
MPQSLAVMTRGLSKFYGTTQALFAVDLDVIRGEIFGFLGPNGSGKTTAIRCLLDLIRPNGGTLRVLDMDPQAEPVAVRARVGYLPGELHLDDNLTAEQALRFFNRLRGGRADPAFIGQLADRLGLHLRTPIKNLSKGNKQKVGLVQALMHRPELLLLDEPTSGLDPLAQQEVLQLLREAHTAGTTIFFSSHILSEVEEIAERVAIIRRGVIVEVAETTSLIRRALRRVRVRFQQPVDITSLTGVPGVNTVTPDGPTAVQLEVTGDMDGLIKALAAFPVHDLETERSSLEEVFLAYYRDQDQSKERLPEKGA